jgi:hypothetical protein
MIIEINNHQIGEYDIDYSITFCCEHMTVVVGVYVPSTNQNPDDDDENRAIELADRIIQDYYGFSPMEFCQETIVDYCGAVA